MPSRVPLAIASIALTGGSSMTSCAAADGSGRNGTISAATASAAGVLITAAIRILPSASGMTGAEERGVEHHHRAGDPGHAAAHQREQLAAREPHQDTAGSAAAPRYGRRRCAPPRRGRAGRRPRPRAAAPRRNACTIALQDAPVEQQRGERADHQHQRQRAEGEDETGAGPGLGKRQSARRRDSRRQSRCRPRSRSATPRRPRFSNKKRRPGRRKFQKQQREGELQQHARRRRRATARARGPRSAPRRAAG